MWRAALKPGTDDVRDSPALDVGVRLCRAGAEVTVFDPQAMAAAKSVAPELTYAATTLGPFRLLPVRLGCGIHEIRPECC